MELIILVDCVCAGDACFHSLTHCVLLAEEFLQKGTGVIMMISVLLH